MVLRTSARRCFSRRSISIFSSCRRAFSATDLERSSKRRWASSWACWRRAARRTAKSSASSSHISRCTNTRSSRCCSRSSWRSSRASRCLHSSARLSASSASWRRRRSTSSRWRSQLWRWRKRSASWRRFSSAHCASKFRLLVCRSWACCLSHCILFSLSMRHRRSLASRFRAAKACIRSFRNDVSWSECRWFSAIVVARRTSTLRMFLSHRCSLSTARANFRLSSSRLSLLSASRAAAPKVGPALGARRRKLRCGEGDASRPQRPRRHSALLARAMLLPVVASGTWLSMLL
mmetsp:Transcript_97562/g.209311  ORF Transcript_97562/g.209311 Transcript_97562/m.209311 type:complete len:292 (-) Transcript_97562:685-1560(-)